MNRLKSSLLVVLALATTIGFVATSSEPASAQGSAALSIAPRKDYTIEPGKEVNDTLLIRNIDREQSLTLTLKVIDFTSDGEGGTPMLMIADDAPQTPWSLRPFMDVPQMVTIEPGENMSVPIKVKIPEDRNAGSYYSAIVYTSSAADGGNVGLNASGVTLVFASIPGEVDENLSLEKIGAYTQNPNTDTNVPDSGVYKFFNIQMPRRIGYTLKNEGNVAENPVGSITLRNIFGQEKTINDINPNRSLALIGQTRTFDPCILLAKEEVDFNGTRQEAPTCADPGLWPGFFTVEINGYYGWNGNATQEIIGKGYFLYTPWWFIFIVVAVFAFIGYHGWRITQFFRNKGGGSGNNKYVARGRK